MNTRLLCVALTVSMVVAAAVSCGDPQEEPPANNDPNNDPNNQPNNDPSPEPEPDPTPDPTPDVTSCDTIEARYSAVITNGSACQNHRDCSVLDGQCGVGLGGCYEVVNDSVTQEELDAFGDEFAAGDCTQGVCDCAEPPTALCEAGRCTFGPECGGRQIGDTFPPDEGCGECACTPEGIVCTEEACDPCEGVELPECPRECTPDDEPGGDCTDGDECGNDIGDGCRCEGGTWGCFIHPPLGEGCNLICLRP